LNGFQHLENLEDLNLSENKLTKLQDNTFQHLPKLNCLDFHKNQINHIDSNAFVNLANLTYLKLYDNQLKKIELCYQIELVHSNGCFQLNSINLN